MITKDLVIIGGGPAGMSAALAAKENGIEDILLLEREPRLGGILNQCIHNGFGLHKFHEELTGPEFAAKYADCVIAEKIPYLTDTTVLSLTRDKTVTYTNEKDGIVTVQAKAVILAMGCRERPRGAIQIPGTRPAGIYTAGTAQKFVNIRGRLPGKEVVILGSGDIGLIMARRMTLEGAKVKAVCEVMPYSGGLARNIEQCLNDFSIPLYLSHTVTNIYGKERITGVTISKVDDKLQPIAGTEFDIACDTLLLSVGLVPENELTKGAEITLSPVTNGAVVDQNRQTEVPGIFACGNVLHVHDLADYVADESEIAGRAAAEFIKSNHSSDEKTIQVVCGENVRYTVPQRITEAEDTKIYFRVTRNLRNAVISAEVNGKTIKKNKRIRVSPGEMETITLSKSDFASFDGNEITIRVCGDQKE